VLELGALQDAEQEWMEALAVIRAALVGGVNSRAAAGVDQMRAELLRLFDSFVIFPTDRTLRLEQGRRQPSEVVSADGYRIELHARPEAIQGFTPAQKTTTVHAQSICQWRDEAGGTQ